MHHAGSHLCVDQERKNNRFGHYISTGCGLQSFTPADEAFSSPLASREESQLVNSCACSQERP
jgi:hypothetical protein